MNTAPEQSYKAVIVKDHPKASASGSVREHIVIAERALGRYLPDGVQVHHVDGNRRNNANANLVICQDIVYHKLLHARARIVKAGGHPDTQRICSNCRAVKDLSSFYFFPNGKYDSSRRNGECIPCAREKAKARSAARPRKKFAPALTLYDKAEEECRQVLAAARKGGR